MKAIERAILSVQVPYAGLAWVGSSSKRKKAAAAKTLRVRNWRAR